MDLWNAVEKDKVVQAARRAAVARNKTRMEPTQPPQKKVNLSASARAELCSSSGTAQHGCTVKKSCRRLPYSKGCTGHQEMMRKKALLALLTCSIEGGITNRLAMPFSWKLMFVWPSYLSARLAEGRVDAVLLAAEMPLVEGPSLCLTSSCSHTIPRGRALNFILNQSVFL